MDYRELLLGCGFRREKLLNPPDAPRSWQNVTTADHNLECNPDVLVDLGHHGWTEKPWPWWDVLPATGIKPAGEFRFEPNYFNEIHAYEVLEHLGAQGDTFTFFHDFYQLWRILKPGGYLCATTPSRYSSWLWGDPGHRRAILPESLVFLSQREYARQVGKTPMSDYRSQWKGDFEIVLSEDSKSMHKFILRAVKS